MFRDNKSCSNTTFLPFIVLPARNLIQFICLVQKAYRDSWNRHRALYEVYPNPLPVFGGSDLLTQGQARPASICPKANATKGLFSIRRDSFQKHLKSKRNVFVEKRQKPCIILNTLPLDCMWIFESNNERLQDTKSLAQGSLIHASFQLSKSIMFNSDSDHLLTRNYLTIEFQIFDGFKTVLFWFIEHGRVSRTRSLIQQSKICLIWSRMMSAQVGARYSFNMQLRRCRQTWRRLSCTVSSPPKKSSSNPACKISKSNFAAVPEWRCLNDPAAVLPSQPSQLRENEHILEQ